MKEACSLQDNSFIWTNTQLKHTDREAHMPARICIHTACTHMHTHTHTRTHTPTGQKSSWFSHWHEKSSQEHCVTIWNMTQNVCFLEFRSRNVQQGCQAKQSQRRKGCFQTFPMHQAIKMTFVCRLLALVLGHIANTWDMSCPSGI